jgi:myotubularin-related protein 6/7/8
MLTTVDDRPLMNALANQLAGAGMEKTTNYRKAKRKFLGIENIHVMRDALYRVAKLPFVYLYVPLHFSL